MQHKIEEDIIFECGIRFHVVPKAELPPRHIMLGWDVQSDEEPCATTVSLDCPLPQYVREFEVTSVFLPNRSMVNDAVAFVRANFGQHGFQ